MGGGTLDHVPARAHREPAEQGPHPLGRLAAGLASSPSTARHCSSVMTASHSPRPTISGGISRLRLRGGVSSSGRSSGSSRLGSTASPALRGLRMITRTDWRVNGLPPCAVTRPRWFHSRMTADTLPSPSRQSAAHRIASASAGRIVTWSPSYPNGLGPPLRRFPAFADWSLALRCRSPFRSVSALATEVSSRATSRPWSWDRSISPGRGDQRGAGLQAQVDHVLQVPQRPEQPVDHRDHHVVGLAGAEHPQHLGVAVAAVAVGGADIVVRSSSQHLGQPAASHSLRHCS